MEAKEISIITSVGLLISLFFMTYEIIYYKDKDEKMTRSLAWMISIISLLALSSLIMICTYSYFGTTYNNEILMNIETSILIVLFSVMVITFLILFRKDKVVSANKLESKIQKVIKKISFVMDTITACLGYVIFMFEILMLVLTTSRVWGEVDQTVDWISNITYVSAIGYALIASCGLLIIVSAVNFVINIVFITESNKNATDMYMTATVRFIGCVAISAGGIVLGLGFKRIGVTYNWFNNELIDLMASSYSNTLFYITMYLGIFGVVFNSLPYIYTASCLKGPKEVTKRVSNYKKRRKIWKNY